MITQIRSASIHDGKADEAFALGVKVAQYVNANHGTNLSVSRNVGGQVFQIHWIMTVESLAAYEELWEALSNDEGYGAVVQEMRDAGVLIGASVTDQILASVG